MKKNYIVLLQNKHLLFFNSKPVKQGKFVQGVRLFVTDNACTCEDICNWSKKRHELDTIKEVKDWE
jgi:hypothetical protein|tara:strand:- start:223 stop:420 length:198 start_codon:yes stop_codon:yes gene_type:complete